MSASAPRTAEPGNSLETSVIMQAIVSPTPATEAAFCRARRVTFVRLIWRLSLEESSEFALGRAQNGFVQGTECRAVASRQFSLGRQLIRDLALGDFPQCRILIRKFFQ